MLDTIFTRDDVKEAINDIITIDKMHLKDIPSRINEERITLKEYSIYMLLDAVVMFSIIIDDESLFPKYLEKLKQIIKKLDTHNDIRLGITKLIVKSCGYKLNIEDYDDIENKKKILKYIYTKYINNGYVYHSFPSVFKENVEENGLNPNYYYHSLDEVKDIDKIFTKYGINNVFSKDLDGNPIISITDSFFMASFYSNNSPLYLQEVCENIYDGNSKKFKKDSYLVKNYKECINNIYYVCKKYEMTSNEINKIIDFFDNEWKELHVKENNPVVAFIPRKVINKNTLKDVKDIIKDINTESIFIIIHKILSTKLNNEVIDSEISSKDIIIKEIPFLKDIYKSDGIEIEEEEKKIVVDDEMNQYGNATILALVGVLLISLGVTVMIIMLGK